MDHLDGTENLTRYLYSKKHIRPSDNSIKPNAFIPPPPSKELSVFRISGLFDAEIWRTGDSLRDKTPLGRADIKAEAVYNTALLISLDNTPPRHANIINWPDEQSAIKLKAIELAQQANLILK